METKVRDFKVGDRVKVTKFYHEEGIAGHEGIVVRPRMNTDVGVDFGKKIGTLTWDLDGTLNTSTGRYINKEGLILILEDWDR